MLDHGRIEASFLNHSGDQATTVVFELFEPFLPEIALFLRDIYGNLFTYVENTVPINKGWSMVLMLASSNTPN